MQKPSRCSWSTAPISTPPIAGRSCRLSCGGPRCGQSLSRFSGFPPGNGRYRVAPLFGADRLGERHLPGIPGLVPPVTSNPHAVNLRFLAAGKLHGKFKLFGNHGYPVVSLLGQRDDLAVKPRKEGLRILGADHLHEFGTVNLLPWKLGIEARRKHLLVGGVVACQPSLSPSSVCRRDFRARGSLLGRPLLLT